MSDTAENATAEQTDAEDPGAGAPLPPDHSLDGHEALSVGPARSFVLSLLAGAMLLTFLGIRAWLGTESPQDSPTSIAYAALTALSVLIAMPSWGVSNVYAVGSLVTGQRGSSLALLALLVNAASAIAFLLPR